MSLNVLVDTTSVDDSKKIKSQDNKLVAWVIDNVDAWVEHRDQNYKAKWEEYYRLWRGIWAESDKSRNSERSKLIAPALQQAVESTAAELEEATFGNGVWFDVEDDLTDQQKQDMSVLRDLLAEDTDAANVPDEVAKVYLYGALYGTGIGKIIVESIKEAIPQPDPTEVKMGAFRPTPIAQEESRIMVRLEAVDPRNFAIDPAARTVDDGLGCAWVGLKPLHSIMDKQKRGIYNDVRMGAYDGKDNLDGFVENGILKATDAVKIVEYYGLVPKSLLPVDLEPDEVLVDLDTDDKGAPANQQEPSPSKLDIEDEELVEAIITIANDSVLLRAVENRFFMKDRPLVAYQHDLVPTSFWGRGVAEKGYNPQKALDAELRARIDGLALASHPMVAVDATRLPRNFNFKVSPGKVWTFSGPPGESMMPFTFGQGANIASFHQSGELERMIQMGTGAMDSATPVGISPRNQTASGMSMMQGGMIKRTKRTMGNISRKFLQPMLQKIAWRYLQFYPERYPIADYKFKIIAAMGIMAREYEQGQLTHLLSVVPPESPPFKVILKGIFNNSSLDNKTELIQALDQMDAPPPPEIQQMQEMMKSIQMQLAQLQVEQAKLNLEKTHSEVIKNFAIAKEQADNTHTERIKIVADAHAKSQQRRNKNE